MLKFLFSFMALSTVLLTQAVAEPRHGTMKSYRLDGGVFDAQIWSGSDFIIVARTGAEAHLGGFPSGISGTVAQAFMRDHGMGSCRITGNGLKYPDVPGVYQVDYRC